MLAVIYLILKQKTTKHLSRKILLLTSDELFHIYLCLEKEAEFFKRSINEEKILEKAFSTRNVAFLDKILENGRLLDHCNIQLDFCGCFSKYDNMDLDDIIYLNRKDICISLEDLYEIIIENDHLEYFIEFYPKYKSYTECEDYNDKNEFISTTSELDEEILKHIADYKSFKIFNYVYENYILEYFEPYGLIRFIKNHMFDFVLVYYRNFNLSEYFLNYDQDKETIIFLKNNEFIVEEYYKEYVDPYNKVIEKIKKLEK